MADLAMFSVKTERGTSRSGHGISTLYNRTPKGRANRKAAESRRLQNRQKRGAWSNESRGKQNEVAFPLTTKAA